MSAETFPLCFSAERSCSTQNLGITDEGQLPRQLKTLPVRPRKDVGGWAMDGAGSGDVWWSYRGGGGRRWDGKRGLP